MPLPRCGLGAPAVISVHSVRVQGMHAPLEFPPCHPSPILPAPLSPPRQETIWQQAQAAWYVTLICNQFWHIWNCKTRQVSLFQHGPFKNPVTLYGVSVAVAVMLIVVYVPFLQPIFDTAALTGIGWVPMLGFGVWVFAYSEWSKKVVRMDPDGWWARQMQW